MIETLESMVEPILKKENFELVDLTYQKEQSGWTLRFYLDKPGGISLDDCAGWSRRLEVILDESNLLDRAYNLEVASPGIDRPLKKTSDFQKYIGKRVHVKLYAPQDGQKNFHGFLTSADDENICINLEDTNKEIQFTRVSVAKANLNPLNEL